MSTTWTALATVPASAPTPKLPDGWESEPVLTDDGTLRGYLCRNGTDERTLAWSQNGSPESQGWRWLPLADLPTPEPVSPDEPPTAQPEPPDEAHAPPYEAPDDAPAADLPPFPFTLLGFSGDVYCYLGHGKQVVTMLKASAHTAGNLYQLAPLSFWARRWKSKRGFDSDSAASDLITLQHRIGVYDPARQRGRGVWWDRKAAAAVVHLGDSLIVGGARVGLHDHASRHIYECAVPIPMADDGGLSNSEANKLIKICEYLSWGDPSYGRLLAGWIVCAFLSGALRWRPSIWIQGEFQSGKSTVFDHVIARALGASVKRFVGGVTEAALRALLRVDALPIMIDDAASNTARGRENLAAILELMKVFSGADGGVIAKASQTGGPPVITNLSCCYAFSSVVMAVDDPQIKSRIATLKLVPRKFEAGQLEELHAKIGDALPPEYSAALFARCVRLLPIIRANAETFAQCVGEHTGQRRSGDLYGHLFAGAYSLFSDKIISKDDALEYVGKRAAVLALMTETKQEIAENNEGDRCLSHLLEQVVTDTLDGRMWRGAIYDLLKMAKGNDLNSAAQAEYLLRRSGIIVKGQNFFVANDHTALRDFYKNTAWAIGWGAILKTIKSAESEPMMSFGGRKTRATRLPLALIADAVAAHSPPPDDDEPPALPRDTYVSI